MKKNINELTSWKLDKDYSVEQEYEFVADESEILELNSHIWLFKGDTLMGYIKIPLDPKRLDFIRSLKKRIDGFEEDCCYEEENYKKLGILDENEILKKQVKQMKVIIGGYKKILYKETKQ